MVGNATPGSGQRHRGEPVEATISFGVTLAADDDTVDTAIARADQTMYQAKQGGGNEVVDHPAPEQE